jgi:hypothetical protein
MLFYSPEDPIEIPYPLERTLHRSQWLPSLLIAAGSTLLLLGLPAHAGAVWCWTMVFFVALAVSLVVPLWCGICYDRSLPSHLLGGLRALALWVGCQALLLALSVVLWGLLLDVAGIWPDFQRPNLPASGPVPALAPAPLSHRSPGRLAPSHIVGSQIVSGQLDCRRTGGGGGQVAPGSLVCGLSAWGAPARGSVAQAGDFLVRSSRHRHSHALGV